DRRHADGSADPASACAATGRIYHRGRAHADQGRRAHHRGHQQGPAHPDPAGVDQGALERLKRHRWPGNVRELENLARRLAALYPQETISAAVIDAELSQPAMVSGDEESRAEEGLSGAVERHLASYFASFGEELPPPGLYHRVLREIEHPLL